MTEDDATGASDPGARSQPTRELAPPTCHMSGTAVRVRVPAALADPNHSGPSALRSHIDRHGDRPMSASSCPTSAAVARDVRCVSGRRRAGPAAASCASVHESERDERDSSRRGDRSASRRRDERHVRTRGRSRPHRGDRRRPRRFDAARRRPADGSDGMCERCRQPIGAACLATVPAARRRTCASVLEPGAGWTMAGSRAGAGLIAVTAHDADGADPGPDNAEDHRQHLRRLTLPTCPRHISSARLARPLAGLARPSGAGATTTDPTTTRRFDRGSVDAAATVRRVRRWSPRCHSRCSPHTSSVPIQRPDPIPGGRAGAAFGGTSGPGEACRLGAR